VILLLVVILVVILMVVVVLVGVVVLLSLGAIGDEVGDVTTLKAALGVLGVSSPLLQNLCITQNFLASKAISSSGMLSYCSSKAVTTEDKTNSKEGEMVLVGLASLPPTHALVIKDLLVKEAS
jgi:hypothetical protein